MLHTKRASNCAGSGCKSVAILLAFCWILGLLIGMFLGYVTLNSVIAYYHNAVMQPASIATLVLAQLLSLLLILICRTSVKPHLLIFILILDAVCCGLNIFGVSAAFRSAAWLVYLLLCFSDTAAAILLLWLSLRCLSGQKHTFKKNAAKCLIIMITVCVFDLSCISPFLVSLMTHS